MKNTFAKILLIGWWGNCFFGNKCKNTLKNACLVPRARGRGGAVICRLGKTKKVSFYVVKHAEKYCCRGARCASKSYGVVSRWR